jgi:hypothetical protein
MRPEGRLLGCLNFGNIIQTSLCMVAQAIEIKRIIKKSAWGVGLFPVCGTEIAQ